MEDSKPILVNGNGTPYLAIFDGAGSPTQKVKETKVSLL